MKSAHKQREYARDRENRIAERERRKRSTQFIQRVFRGYRGRKFVAQLRADLRQKELQAAAAAEINRIARGKLGRMRYQQQLFRQNEATQCQASALRIQARYRCYRIRRLGTAGLSRLFGPKTRGV